MSEVLLYHVPPSFYSQIARISLAEKGVRWKSKWLAAGPPTFESYEPWYMRLNPGGTVPTLVHDGHCIPDSFAIARYADQHFEGPALIPAAIRPEVERWMEKLGDISLRELSYGAEKLAWIAPRINAWRIRRLKKQERKYPALADIYREKQKDIEGFSANFRNPAHVEKIREQVRNAFGEMETTLGKHPWLCGEQYTLADAFWTVAVARFTFLDLDPLSGRPALADWYSRVKTRPSFRAADVWESFKVSKLLPVLLQKLGPRLAVILLVIAGLGALIGWLL